MQESKRWNPTNEHHAYFMAHNVIYDMADDYFKSIEKPIVRIKYHTATTAEKEHISGRTDWFGYDYKWYFPRFAKSGRLADLDIKCEHWFHNNCKDMISAMLRCNGWKNIEQAINGTKNYNDLCGRWDEWFERKRETFMKETNEKIMEQKGAPAKMPSSHGGVANLLKLLTNTMIKRGAGLDTIAKVQYAVCSQAGIYIPSEFLTDCAVVLDYKDKMEQIERS